MGYLEFLQPTSWSGVLFYLTANAIVFLIYKQIYFDKIYKEENQE